jgi:hypothetical protein
MSAVVYGLSRQAGIGHSLKVAASAARVDVLFELEQTRAFPAVYQWLPRKRAPLAKDFYPGSDKRIGFSEQRSQKSAEAQLFCTGPAFNARSKAN